MLCKRSEGVRYRGNIRNMHTFRNNDDVFFALFQKQKQLDAMKGFQDYSFDKYELDHIGDIRTLQN